MLGTTAGRLYLDRERGRVGGRVATTDRTEFRNPSPQSSPLGGERREQRHRLRCVSQLARSTFVAGLIAAANCCVTAAKVLPIYIEDNHAGTFYWLAKNIDLDQSYTFILFDAHSDASGIFDSDKIRYALRNVASTQDRQTLLDRWRGNGSVQCFNWIEPLMPAPFRKVIWVPAEKFSASQIREHRQQATALLDGHLEAAPRKSGSLREPYLVSDFEHLEKEINRNRQLIVTIDLDYFAGLAAAEQQQAFARIWSFIIERPNLRAITFAISRAYLNDEPEANRLLKLALTSALSLPTAQIEFEPFLTVANDHSDLAKKLIVKGEKPPVFDVAQITQELRAREFCLNVSASRCGTMACVGSNCCVSGTTKRRDCVLKSKIASLPQIVFGAFQLMIPPTSNCSSSLGPLNRTKSNGLR